MKRALVLTVGALFVACAARVSPDQSVEAPASAPAPAAPEPAPVEPPPATPPVAEPPPAAPPPAEQAPVPLRCSPVALPGVHARLRAAEPLTVVAIGTSSIKGVGASSPGRNFPNQLQEKLRAAFPDVAIKVHNKGVNGEVASQTLARFDRDVHDLKPDLVIFQAGMNDVVREVDLERFARTLDAAFDDLKSRGYDVLFMDMQYYQEAPSNRYAEFLTTMQGIAGQRGVPLLPRHDLMKSFVTAGVYALPEILWEDGFHMNDVSYEFTAQCGADMILPDGER